MKRYLIIAAIVLSALLAACAPPPAPVPEPEPAPPETPEFTVPTFLLSELPQLAPYVAPREIFQRYYDEEFVGELRPAADYGRLYPYEGKVFGEQWWESRVYYGLADERGRVVVDPVYRYAYVTDSGYLLLSYPVGKDDTKAQELLRESDGWIQRCRHVLAKPDGSWVSGDFYGDEISAGENRIVVNDYGEDMQNMWGTRNRSYRIYDMQGQLVASGEGRLDGFQDGLARLCYSADGQFEDRYCYLDTDGNVAIPGPFIDAYNFVDGCAQVSLGEDWESRQFATINTQGEYVMEPGPEWITSWGDQPDYLIFENPGADASRGIKDRAGNVIAPAIYSWINLPYEEGVTLAVGSKVNYKTGETYWLIDLQNGEARQIEIENATVNYAQIVSGNWCVAEYYGGTALLKGDIIYRFDAEGGNRVDCRQLKDELFALSGLRDNEGNRESYYVDIFDAGTGRVLHSVTGMQFSHVTGELLVMYLPENYEYMRVLNFDATPAFNGALGGEIVRSVGLVEDDVYTVRTNMYSGLIRPNGEWLLRVNVNNLD